MAGGSENVDLVRELPWQQPEWLREARSWIDEMLAQAGVRQQGGIVQDHIRPWSTVLLVPTDSGNIYFKAPAPPARHEARLVELLSRIHPDSVLAPLAIEPERGWMLFREGGERIRHRIRAEQDIRPWCAILPDYARLQMQLTERLPDLMEAGVPARPLSLVPELYEELLRETRLLRLDQEDGLTTGEYADLCTRRERVAETCVSLSSLGIPATLQHGDLHDGNIFGRDGRYLIFDWGDASISHPFVSLRTTVVSVEISLGLEDGKAPVKRLRDAYLQPWESWASSQELRQAFVLAGELAPLHTAFVWQRILQPLHESVYKEWRHAIPSLLREYLSGDNVLQC